MYLFSKSSERWWNKPLVVWNCKSIPAELAVLNIQLETWPNGAWLNSTKLSTGVVDLVGQEASRKVERIPIPNWVKERLSQIYEQASVSKGCPDVVVWNEDTRAIHLLEVKRYKKDRLSVDQKRYMEVAPQMSVSSEVIEWDYE
ncbi:MAG: VRR-NUC domain-containing protein [Halieaceae bacterium]